MDRVSGKNQRASTAKAAKPARTSTKLSSLPTRCFGQIQFDFYEVEEKDQISQEEMIHDVVVHLRGIRHTDSEGKPEEISNGRYYPPLNFWLDEFREMSLKDDYMLVEDTDPWELLLNACFDDDYDSFLNAMTKVGIQRAPSPLRTVAFLAIERGRHRILQFCLVAGLAWERDLIDACQNQVDTVEMMEVLYRFDWASIRTDSQQTENMIEFWGHDSLQGHWLRTNALPRRHKYFNKDLNDRDSRGRNARLRETFARAFDDINW